MKIKAKGPEFVELDYTPMIDMTFQLIAFFMILINFSDAEVDDRVQLPASSLAKPPSAPSDMPLTIQMVRDGKIIMNAQLLPAAKKLLTTAYRHAPANQKSRPLGQDTDRHDAHDRYRVSVADLLLHDAQGFFHGRRFFDQDAAGGSPRRPPRSQSASADQNSHA